MSTRARLRQASGFTLVELLVVIGIIALLISILLPVLGRARDSANKVVCLSAVRQISNSFRMYATDNKDWFPFSAPLGPTTDRQEEYIHWRGGIGGAGIKSSSVAQYLGGQTDTLEKIFRCPSDVGAEQRKVPKFGYSYSMNLYFDPRGPYDGPYAVKNGIYPGIGGPASRLSKVKNASEKIVLAEENEVTINDGFWVPGVSSPTTLSDWYCEWDWLSIRHDNVQREFAERAPKRTPISGLNNRSKKGVVVFADGHADSVARDYAHDPYHVLPRL